MREMIIAIFSGGVFVAMIEGFREYLAWKRQRKASIEDRNLDADKEREEQAMKRIDAMEIKVDALIKCQRFILYDRIRHLGQKIIEGKEIDLNDRKVINDMFELYKNALGGENGLDILMEEVNRLPLRKKEKRSEGILI